MRPHINELWMDKKTSLFSQSTACINELQEISAWEWFLAFIPRIQIIRNTRPAMQKLHISTHSLSAWTMSWLWDKISWYMQSIYLAAFIADLTERIFIVKCVKWHHAGRKHSFHSINICDKCGTTVFCTPRAITRAYSHIAVIILLQIWFIWAYYLLVRYPAVPGECACVKQRGVNTQM